MENIEDKLKLFEEMVYQRVKKEKEEEIILLKNTISENLEKEKERIEQKLKEEEVETLRRANAKLKEMTAREKLKKDQEILLLKKQLLQELIFEVEELLMQFTNSEKYKVFIFKEIEQNLAALEDGNYNVYFTKKDIERYGEEIKLCFKDKRVVIKLAEYKIIGGFIFEDSSGKIRRDNTIKSRLEDLYEYTGLRLNELISQGEGL